jgi:hypothetical protein
MGTSTDTNGHDLIRVRAMADSMGCLLDEDLQELAQVKASTTEAWRKRGHGPDYAMLGNRILYTKDSVMQFLKSRIRQQKPEMKGAFL